MSFRLPHLATQQQIEQWAATYSTRAKLPNLVRRLIRALVPGVEELSMPGDEHVDLSGYDGIVTSPIQTPFVPLGKSVWEFGTNADPQAKANEDYRTRTKNSLGIERSTTTFVFVTPRRWPGAAKWAAKKAALGEWKDVVVRTSADLYAAIEQSPRVHVWFSEELGIPSNGISTLSNWWDRYTTNAKGLITPELLVAGRADEVAHLLREFLDTDSAHIWIKAPTTEDVLAFVSAAIMMAEPETREGLLDRALVVFDPGALSYLDGTEGLLILVPFEESLMRQADLVIDHHVVMHTSGGVETAMTLPAVPIRESEKILRDAGVESNRAAQLSKALGKSLPLFKQRVTGLAGAGLVVAGADIATSQLGRRSCLLGSWNFAQAGDTAVFESLTGKTVELAQADLDKLAAGGSPVLTHVNSAWKVFDAKASFTRIAPVITTSDLQGMERVIQEVLGAVDPRLDLPRADRWRASLDGKVRAHSSDMRSGVARTIALLGAEGDDGQLVGGVSLRGWAELTTRALLQRANADTTGKLWESLFDVLSLLGEAAPDQFMTELEAALAPGGALEGRIFEDSSDFMSPTSPHVYLLWALETIAWSPEYFGGAVMLVSKLAELDPGGKLSNRPISTLTNLFLPWHPQTGATLNSRNRVLSKLCKEFPRVAWDLLQALLPDAHAVAMEGSGPEFRSWRSEVADKPVTMAAYFDAVQHVLTLSIEMASKDSLRLPDLVGKLDDLTPALRAQLLGVFDRASSSDLPPEVRNEIWKKLTSLIRRHRQYKDADWSLDEDALEELDLIADKFKPSDEAGRVEWLFEHSPDLGDVDVRTNYQEYIAAVSKRQLEAVDAVYRQSKLAGLIELSKNVQQPWVVGFAAANSSLVEIDMDDIAPLLIDESDPVRNFATASITKKLSSDLGELVALGERHADQPLLYARLLRMADDLTEAWAAALQAGEEVDKLYWSEFETFGRGDFMLVNETAEQLRRHHRYARALDLMAIYSHNQQVQLDPKLIVELLDELIEAKEDAERAALSQYDLAGLLEYVRNSGQVEDEVLGLLEWRLLPALDSSSSIAALQSLLASSPEFFVQIISYLYRRKGADSNDEKHPPNVVENAWRLLHRWDVIPGSKEEGGEIDEVAFNAWIDATRKLLVEADRLDVGEAHIGQVLAHSKADGDLWPSLPVRNFLDDSSTDVINRNFVIGIGNMRGVVSRGLAEGGDQERALAEKYEGYAALIKDEWPRTARLLRTVADVYRREAARYDEEAQREQEGFDR